MVLAPVEASAEVVLDPEENRLSNEEPELVPVTPPSAPDRMSVDCAPGT